MTKDLGIYESGNGGELYLQNNDLILSEQLYQQAYLALFGGNVEADTLGNEVAGQIRSDWWGNALLLDNQPNKQFNSQTERALRYNALTSAGRVQIIRAVQADLKYLSSTATVTIDATIPGNDQLVILITISQPATNQSAVMQIIWDNASKELIIEKVI